MKYTATLERLAAYQAWGLKMYRSPAGPYWASRPQFYADEYVANPEDFLEAAGYDRAVITPEEVEALGDTVLEVKKGDL